METASPDPAQMSFLHANLLDQLNPRHPLLKLAKAVPWAHFEAEFASLYSARGKPAKPIRLRVGLSMLKHLENLSDEILIERWVQNPYHPVFCGETEFQWQLPCDPSEMTYFRKRIGTTGFETIFAASIALHGDQALEDEVCVDTTVQEKNITFPTDAKQYRKIHVHLVKLAQVKRLRGQVPGVALCDRGYRGKSCVNETQILIPRPARKNAAKEVIDALRKRFQRRAGHEPVIGHLKSDHRLNRNFLKGFTGDQINLLMAAAAFNFRTWLRKVTFWLRCGCAGTLREYDPPNGYSLRGGI